MLPSNVWALIKKSARVGLYNLVAQVPAFFVPLATASVIGASGTTDAFFLAFSAATFIVSAIAGASQATVPYLVADRDRMLRRASRLLISASLILHIVALGGLGALLHHFGLLAVDSRAAMETFLVALTPWVLLSVLSAIWTWSANADGNYRAGPLAMGARGSLVLGVVIVAGPIFAAWGLVLAYLVGEVVRAAMLFRAVSENHSKSPAVPNMQPKARLSGFDGSVASQITASALLATVPILDRALAHTLGPGNTSLLEYAEKIWQVPISLAMAGFTVVLLSEWSKQAFAGGAIESLRPSAAALALWLFVATLPFSATFVIYREPLTALLFKHGALAHADISSLADTLAVLIAGVPFYLPGLIFTRLILVARRADILLVVTLMGIALKVALNLALMPHWGLPGLAAATSFMYGFNSFVMIALALGTRTLTARRGSV